MLCLHSNLVVIVRIKIQQVRSGPGTYRDRDSSRAGIELCKRDGKAGPGVVAREIVDEGHVDESLLWIVRLEV